MPHIQLAIVRNVLAVKTRLWQCLHRALHPIGKVSLLFFFSLPPPIIK